MPRIMKKFQDEAEAVQMAEKLYWYNDWTVMEDEDGLFYVSPPTLVKCPVHLLKTVGDVGTLANILHTRSYVIVDIDGDLFYQTTE